MTDTIELQDVNSTVGPLSNSAPLPDIDDVKTPRRSKTKMRSIERIKEEIKKYHRLAAQIEAARAETSLQQAQPALSLRTDRQSDHQLDRQEQESLLNTMER